MIITITGANQFASKKRLDQLISKFVSKYGELALEKFDGDEDVGGAIVEAISNLPFLAQKKMVVVRDGSANPKLAEQVEQVISSVPEWCELILYEPGIDRRSAYFKVLKAKTKFEDYPELDPLGLAKWLVGEARNQGGELSFIDARYLIERLGTNQFLLYNELQKLLIYKAKISREAIDQLVEPTPQSRFFDLLDAAFNGQKRRALKLYEDQRAQKVEPQAILAIIAWQLQVLTLVKHADSKKPPEIAKDSGLSLFPVQKAANLAAKMTAKQVERLVEELLNIDFKAKTSAYDLDEALKTYIALI